MAFCIIPLNIDKYSSLPFPYHLQANPSAIYIWLTLYVLAPVYQHSCTWVWLLHLTARWAAWLNGISWDMVGRKLKLTFDSIKWHILWDCCQSQVGWAIFDRKLGKVFDSTSFPMNDCMCEDNCPILIWSITICGRVVIFIQNIRYNHHSISLPHQWAQHIRSLPWAEPLIYDLRGHYIICFITLCLTMP